MLDGAAVVNGTKVTHRDLVVLDNIGEVVTFESDAPARLLLLSGDPIDEPVVSHGPFVMNTRDQIIEAIDDFSAGGFGYLEE